VDIDKFLKLTHLFCDKENIPFFYPSYSYLLKIIEFLDVELPSSADIENFSSRLSEEYVSVTLSEDHKERLGKYLETRLPKTKNIVSKNEIEDNSRIASIPPPPSKKQQESTSQEEME
jgi:hypothetical protein